MKPRRFAICVTLSAAFYLFIGVSLTAHAATTIRPGPNDRFSTVAPDNTPVSCARYRGRWVPVRPKGSKVMVVSLRLKELKNLIKSTTLTSAQTRLKREQRSLLAYQRKAAPLCADGPPAPVVDLLTEKTSPSTEWDVRYLYEKAALGAVPQAALDALASGGISAVIDLLTTKIQDPTLLTQAALWLDNDATNNTPVGGNIPAQGPVSVLGLPLYMLHQLIETKNPFHARLGLLWGHNMVPISTEALRANNAVTDNQFPLYRVHIDRLAALGENGDYKAFLKATTIDGAMLHWLDGRSNIKQEPNENFARELLELFTMSPTNKVDGTSNYNEFDVSKAALALAGYTTTNQSIGGGQFAWDTSIRAANVHTGAVVLFADTPHARTVQATSNLQPANDQVVDATFAHPGTKYYLAYRLLIDYVTPDPSTAIVKALGDYLEAQGYNLILTLKKLLKSEYFYLAEHRKSLITTPTERLIIFLRQTKIPYEQQKLLSMSAGGGYTFTFDGVAGIAAGGHLLSRPPTVFGWDMPDFANSGWQIALFNTVLLVSANDSYFNQLVGGVPRFKYESLLPPGDTRPEADDVITHLQHLCNVPNLSAEDRNDYWDYLNNAISCPGGAGSCAGNQVILSPRAWDWRVPGIVRQKMAGLVRLVCLMHSDTQFR